MRPYSRWHSHPQPLLILVLICSTLAISALAGNILWDDCHDANGDELNGNFSLLEDVIEAEGHSITELDGVAGDITAEVLAGYDALWIFDAEIALTAGEIVAIQDFVDAGGGLLVAFDVGCDLPSHNALLAPYSIELNGDEIHSEGYVFTMFNAHPVTDALDAVGIDYGSTLNIRAGAIVLIAGDDDDVLAVHGTQRVAVFGDTATFADPNPAGDTSIMQHDNVVLASNLVEWTTGGGPVSVDVQSWSNVKSLFR